MGIGSTAKKIQQIVDLAEELYSRLNQVREQLVELRGTVEETGERVSGLEAENERQRVLLEALAREQGLDVDAILDDVAVPEEGETTAETPAEATTDAAE